MKPWGHFQGFTTASSLLSTLISGVYPGVPSSLGYPWVELYQITVDYISWFAYGVTSIWMRGRAKKQGRTHMENWQQLAKIWPIFEILLVCIVPRMDFLLSNVLSPQLPWGFPPPFLSPSLPLLLLWISFLFPSLYSLTPWSISSLFLVSISSAFISIIILGGGFT